MKEKQWKLNLHLFCFANAIVKRLVSGWLLCFASRCDVELWNPLRRQTCPRRSILWASVLFIFIHTALPSNNKRPGALGLWKSLRQRSVCLWDEHQSVSDRVSQLSECWPKKLLGFEAWRSTVGLWSFKGLHLFLRLEGLTSDSVNWFHGCPCWPSCFYSAGQHIFEPGRQTRLGLKQASQPMKWEWLKNWGSTKHKCRWKWRTLVRFVCLLVVCDWDRAEVAIPSGWWGDVRWRTMAVIWRGRRILSTTNGRGLADGRF